MIYHRMPFDDLNPKLPTQIPHDLSKPSPYFPVENLSPILRNPDNVVFVLPSHVC